MPLRATLHARRYGRSAWPVVDCSWPLLSLCSQRIDQGERRSVIGNQSAVCQSRFEQLVLIALSDGPGRLAQATKDLVVFNKKKRKKIIGTSNRLIAMQRSHSTKALWWHRLRRDGCGRRYTRRRRPRCRGMGRTCLRLNLADDLQVNSCALRISTFFLLDKLTQ